jgi:predicted DNA-binding protein with PD1-like motif
MQWRLLDDREGRRVFAVVLATNDEFPKVVLEFLRETHVTSAWLTAVGAFANATIAFWDPATKQYLPIRITEQVEVLSLVGNVTLTSDSRKIHAHVVLGNRDGHARGGHVLEAHVFPTLEMILTESSVPLTRQVDEATGLPLIRFDPPVTR